LVTYIEAGTQEEGVGEWGVEDIWAWDEVTGVEKTTEGRAL
jgi:hypothetical protein